MMRIDTGDFRIDIDAEDVTIDSVTGGTIVVDFEEFFELLAGMAATRELVQHIVALQVAEKAANAMRENGRSEEAQRFPVQSRRRG